MQMLTSIEYHGSPNTTASCVRAVERLLLHDPRIEDARLLTCRKGHDARHGLLLATDDGPVAIRTGFTSGYPGEGPRGLGRSLHLLDLHRIMVGEIHVSIDLLDRLDRCVLTTDDLRQIESTRPTYGPDVYDYVHPYVTSFAPEGSAWHASQASIPYAVLDPRLFDLAVDFWVDPDAALMKAFRKLETIIAERLLANGIDPNDMPASKLFPVAFNRPDGPLTWRDLSSGEVVGRVNLFVGTYSAYRNARVHREGEVDEQQALIELLAVNHLFLLEGRAVERERTMANP
ncbi:hypothetical protein JQC91_17875 [Jannaschia sp. Os4]|uniref:hypothetical protein n=1 Tax=Jannaschia sp. Os4 TaxID=2807617 RepID=UPI0019398D5A|nr:hypothetical protein [Jannaschia sp. Os4]MBM2578180.1 hypothetical protein [Jannaschia sp. Os4]